jgi:hypothetical protein
MRLEERIVMPTLKPGFAFSLVCDLGFAVGLMTHHVDRIGHLVWIAVPIFGQQPSPEDVVRIESWRWPVFFPLEAAVRRKIVTEIGMIPVPPFLQAFPILRSGSHATGWAAFTEVDGERRMLGPTKNRSLPIYKVVNDTRLKARIISGWSPEQQW